MTTKTNIENSNFFITLLSSLLYSLIAYVVTSTIMADGIFNPSFYSILIPSFLFFSLLFKKTIKENQKNIIKKEDDFLIFYLIIILIISVVTSCLISEFLKSPYIINETSEGIEIWAKERCLEGVLGDNIQYVHAEYICSQVGFYSKQVLIK